MKMVKGDGLVTFSTDDFCAKFDGNGLRSLQYDGEEMLAGIPKPVFAHAFTDNEVGYKHDQASMQWFAASVSPKPFNMKTMLDPPTPPETTAVVGFTVASPGLIGVDMTIFGKMGMSDLPLYGVQIPLKKKFDDFIYYGKGPDENYIDRASGCKIDVYGSSARDNVTPYLRPQECGNRTEVRWTEVLDSQMKGIRASMVHHPLQISVLPYSFLQLQEAEHQYELPAPTKTWLTVMGDHMGVGGEDSWGLPVLREYIIDSNQNHSFSFILSRAQSLDLFEKAREAARHIMEDVSRTFQKETVHASSEETPALSRVQRSAENPVQANPDLPLSEPENSRKTKEEDSISAQDVLIQDQNSSEA